MGCVGSRHGRRRHQAPVEAADVDDASPTVFYVQNVDDQGAELNEGQLEVEPDRLVLRQRNGTAIEWPLRCLRRYGFNEELFSFESGRRCMTGPGIFAFKCRRAGTLFHTLQSYLQMSGQQQQQHGSLVAGGTAAGGGSSGQRRPLVHAGAAAPSASLHGGVSIGQPQQQPPLLHLGPSSAAPLLQRERYMEPPQASPQPPLHELRPLAAIVEPYLRPLSIRNGGVSSAGSFAAAAHDPASARSGSAAAAASLLHDSGGGSSHTYMNGVLPMEAHNYVNTNGSGLLAMAASAAVTGGASAGAPHDGGRDKERCRPELNYADLDLPRPDDSPCKRQLPGDYLNVTGDMMFMDVCGAHSSSDEDDMFDPDMPGYVNVMAGGGHEPGASAAAAASSAGAGGSASSSRASSMRRKQQDGGGGGKKAGAALNYANLDCVVPAGWSAAAAGLRKVNYASGGDASVSEKLSIKKSVEEKHHSQHYSQIDIQKTVALSTKVTNTDDHVIGRKTRHDSSADDLQ